MNLLIVESPGKIKKLQSILGSQWAVAASVGHVRDLPEKSLGIDTNTFKPQYLPTDRGKEVLAKLKKMVEQAGQVYLATDPDREGEAIAWHLEDALNLKNPKRVTYTSITEKDVLEGIGNARSIDMALVKAQEGRRVLDRFCGYMVSSPLSNVAGERFSAGRVQSPAVRLVVDKERAISSFISTTHYGVELLFKENDQEFSAQWKTENFLNTGEEYILDQELAKKVATLKTLEIKEFIESERKKAPPAPFTTSSLQQASSNALKFNPKKTMELAQKLYENGHITYMRTDSPNLSDEAIAEIFAYCDKCSYPRVDKARTWKSKEGAQEAHEAVRPTHFEIEDVDGTADEKALYQLIRLRAIASQLQDAVYAVRTVKLEAELEGKAVYFEAKGSLLTFQGWKVLFESDQATADDTEEEEANTIPLLEAGNSLTANSAKVLTKKTKPPTRYTQASLIRDLEKSGIGRPATYAAIMDNILSREYIAEKKQKLEATAKGEKLIELLYGQFGFLELDYTKEMEDRLDDIAMGKADYMSLVSDVYNTLTIEVDKFRKAKAVPCPACKGLNLSRKFKAKEYDFFACADCKATFANVNGQPVVKEKREIPLTDFECTSCKSKLKHIMGEKDGRKYDFFACSNNDCKLVFDNENGQPVAKKPKEEAKKTQYKCPKCKSPLYEKPTKNGGVWFPCSGYPKCKEKFWADENGKPKFK